MVKERDNMGKILVFAVCLFISYLASFIGSIFTRNEVNSSWYYSIRPALTPPNYVFPVVWGILFFLIGASLFLAWTSSKKNEKKMVAFVFGLNLILNVLWSYFYFGLHSPLLGFVDIILMLISIVWMIVVCYPINKNSSYLLVPYLIWVLFATVLNYLSITF